MKFLIVDTANLFYRSRHVQTESLEDSIGLAMHTILAGIRKVSRNNNIDHVVFVDEGRSWRKIIYPAYKANRIKTDKTEQDVNDDEVFFSAKEDFRTFMKTKSNCTVLRDGAIEADDFVARWIDKHPNDEHIIFSSDTDFIQLIAPNVTQYDAIKKVFIRIDGVFDEKNRPVLDKKTKTHIVYDPEYCLFMKCIRGDSTDNIMSAYPGVREKSSKKSIGIKECYEDRHNKGYAWNNFMLSSWTHHDGSNRIVREEYERNKSLIDLRAQPDEIKQIMDLVIEEEIKKEKVKNIGFNFMKFCNRYELNKIIEDVDSYVAFMNKPYA